MLDRDYMRLALRLARRGWGKTSPNPMVGAVMVKNNRIIGQGFHRYFGGDHAEVDALKNATESVEGATLYVTLEPCAHFGKTPPCVDAIIASKIGRVVVGVTDPNPLVQDKGIEKLRQSGIETIVGILEEECRSLSEAHFKYMSTGVPFVTLKYAQTLDGRIATATGDSRWISSQKFQRFVHRLRVNHDAIMVGIGTVLVDDPQLTVRVVKGRNPLRVILDSGLRIPLDARVLGKEAPTVIVSTSRADSQKLSQLQSMGIEVLMVERGGNGEVDLKRLMELLGKRGISSVLVEGGSEIVTSLLRLGLADKLVVAVAPKIIGKGIESVGDLNIARVSQSLKLLFTKVSRMGEDLVIEARPLRAGKSQALQQ